LQPAGLPPFCRPAPDGLSVLVRVTPNAADDRITGPVTRDDGTVMLAVRVRAVPEDGKANKAVIRLLATTLGLRKADIAVASGHTARNKTLAVSGDPAALAAAFAGMLRK
jgi:uncharacterized protein (TIGR00251 family)